MEGLPDMTSKAEYIAAIVREIIVSGRQIGIIDDALLAQIHQQLQNIADMLNQYGSKEED